MKNEKKILLLILIGAFSNCIFGQSDPSSLPTAFNWRDLGKMTSVKNQGSGCSFAYATLGVLESLIKIHFNEFPEDVNHPDLSEQHLIDKGWEGIKLDPKKPHGLCVDETFDSHGFYLIQSVMGGVYSEECYPSVENSTPSNPRGCELNYPAIIDHLSYLTDGPIYPDCDVETIWTKLSIYNNGPIYARLGSSEGFENFRNKSENDVFVHNPNDVFTKNHSLVLCGWDDNKGTLLPSGKHKGAWLVKNSWGIGWGNNGYAWVEFESKILEAISPVECFLKNTTSNITLNTNKSSQIGGYIRAANDITLEPGFEFTPTPSNPAIPIPASINGSGGYNAYQNPNSFLSINTIQLDAVPLRAPKAFYGFDVGSDKDKEDNSNQLKEQVFPNPTHGEFTVRMNLPEHQTSEIRVYDSIGKLVKSVVASATETVVSIEDQSAGIYFVRYTVDGKDQSAKVVKL